jgi:hypothetical protein
MWPICLYGLVSLLYGAYCSLEHKLAALWRVERIARCFYWLRGLLYELYGANYFCVLLRDCFDFWRDGVTPELAVLIVFSEVFANNCLSTETCNESFIYFRNSFFSVLNTSLVLKFVYWGQRCIVSRLGTPQISHCTRVRKCVSLLNIHCIKKYFKSSTFICRDELYTLSCIKQLSGLGVF